MASMEVESDKWQFHMMLVLGEERKASLVLDSRREFLHTTLPRLVVRLHLDHEWTSSSDFWMRL